MAIPDELKVEHLILLVGGNPLPNYVAARAMCNAGGVVSLICSRGRSGTRKIAEALAEILKLAPESVDLGGNFQFNFVEVDERDARSIIDGTSKLLKEITNAVSREGRIGLNYTGGTKVMSVHAYRAVERVAHEHGLRVQYSYLDASTLSFRLHDANGNQTRMLRADDVLVLPLERLFRMHHIRLDGKQPPHTTPIAPQLATALANLHSTSTGAQLWFSVRREKSKGWTQLPSSEPALSHVEAAWRVMCSGNEPTPECVARALGFEELKSCADYFKGKWLEDYVLDQLQRTVQRRDDCVDATAGLKCIRKVRDSEADNFDLDVVMMRAYQPFTFSCIVSNDKEACKEHLTEVFLRARQLGGDEARIGLVCLYDQPKRLQVEIENAWDADGKVKVFGMSELPELAQGIEDWLNEQGQEVR